MWGIHSFLVETFSRLSDYLHHKKRDKWCTLCLGLNKFYIFVKAEAFQIMSDKYSYGQSLHTKWLLNFNQTEPEEEFQTVRSLFLEIGN